MFDKLIATWIALGGFLITVVSIIIKLATRLVTLEQNAAKMEMELCKIMQVQAQEIEQTRRELSEHDKNIAVLSSQMTDVKNIVTNINSKLDRLIATN